MPVAESRESVYFDLFCINHTVSDLGGENEHVQFYIGYCSVGGERQRSISPEPEPYHIERQDHPLIASIHQPQESKAKMREEFIGSCIKVDVVSVRADRSVRPGNPEIGSYGEMPVALDGCTCGRGRGRCGVWTPGAVGATSAVGARQRVRILEGCTGALTSFAASMYGPCSLGVDGAANTDSGPECRWG